MILSISNFFIKRPVFATVCSIIITLLGIAVIPLLPVAQFPEITPPQVTVTANYVGANAEVVESTVTNILERELNGVEGVKYISSTSANDGTSTINLTFALERNKDIAAVDVQNRVSSVLSRLPGPVTQTGVRVEKQTSGFLLAIGVYSDAGPDGKPIYDDVYLSNYTDLYVADAIKRIKGVGSVIIFGERKYAMRLWLDPDRMASRKLTPQDVVNALQDQNLQVGAGQIGQQPADPNQQYQMTINARGRLQKPEEFGNIVIPNNSGTLVYLRDVGRVELGAENYGSVLRFGRRDDKTGEMVISQGIGLGVSQLPGSNALQVADAVLAEMAKLQRSFPPGMHYQDAFNTTAFIKAGVEEVVKTLFETVVLVIIVIFLFLQNWRATLIPAIAIPVSLIGTFLFVKLLGFSINTLTLFGLSLATGLVVDDAIVVVEDITRRIQDEGMSPLQAARASMNILLSAVIATSLVLIAVFVPVAFFPGTTGQLYKQFALTIAFSITISTFNAITLTPTLAALLLRQGQAPDNWFFNGINRWITWTRRGYDRNLQGIVRLKWLILAGFTVGLIITGWFYGVVPQAFLPEEDQGYFITIVQGPEGVSLNYTTDVLKQAEDIIKEEKHVKNIFAVGGFSFSGNTPNNGIIFTTLEPWDEREGAKNTAKAIIGTPFPPPGSGLFPKLLGIQEATVIPFAPPAIQGLGQVGGFSFHLQDRRGIGFEAMGETLGKFMARATTYPSPQSPQLTGLRPNFSANTPQLNVEVDRVKANALQVSLGEIFSTLQIFLGSQYVNDFNQFERTYRVYVQADQPFRSSPGDIQKLYVRSRTGQMIPLSSLVTVTQTTAPSIINHFNLSRSIEIQGGPAPGVSSGQAIAAMEQVAQETLPQGFGYEWAGISLEELEAGGQALLIFGLGVVFVFLVLAAQYESYIDPIIIMLTVPLAVLGALVAIWGRGMLNFILSIATGVPLPSFANDVYTQIGLVMLVGIASKNAILIVEFANQLREEGYTIPRAAIKASEGRLRPILMTAFASVAGAIPLLVAGGAGAAARQSLGTAIVGGICISTLLSLFIVPVLYIVIKSLESWLGWESHREHQQAAPAIATMDGNGSYQHSLDGHSADHHSQDGHTNDPTQTGGRSHDHH